MLNKVSFVLRSDLKQVHLSGFYTSAQTSRNSIPLKHPYMHSAKTLFFLYSSLYENSSMNIFNNRYYLCVYRTRSAEDRSNILVTGRAKIETNVLHKRLNKSGSLFVVNEIVPPRDQTEVSLCLRLKLFESKANE